MTTLADSGAGSLRDAIDTANGDAGPTTIDFAGGLAGGTIALASPLPSLTEGGTTIDGDLGGDCDPDIQIDGSSAGVDADGLVLSSSGNTVRGLAIFDFDRNGIQLSSDDNVVECSYIGTNLALASGHGNGRTGIEHNSGSDNRFGPDNVVAYNSENGLRMIEGDTGAYPLFSALTPDDIRRYPVIDFDDSCGAFESADAIVPTDGGGAPFTENFGLRLTGQLNLGASGDYTFTLPVLDDEARLLVDGNEELNVGGPGPQSTIVTGMSSGTHTIELDFLEGGGAAQLELNITGPGSATLSTDSNTGGCSTGQSGLCGELFRLRVPSERNTITESSFHANGAQGIALNCCCGPLANDAGDLDVGANTILNHPVITGVVYSGTPGSYTVSGTAPPDATVELFTSDGNSVEYGEGETYLASFSASGGGAFSGSAVFAAGEILTTTATDTDGNTSEFGPNFHAGGGVADHASVGTSSGLPGAIVEIPIWVRDRSLTALGGDRPAGEKIQSLSFKVAFSPSASIATKSAARAGITAALTPISQSTPSTASTISYIGVFNEVTNLIPFTVESAAPGDQVAKLTFTLAADAPVGTITLTLDPLATATLLGNQAGTIEETVANGGLALTSGSITVLSNAAQSLFAQATSSSEILLTWSDPGANETGFRIERSTDGASWGTVTTVGPNATSFTDTGRAPATLYYYRLVTLIAPSSTSSQVSNVGFATTFASTAAKVCVQRLPGFESSWANAPSAAWNDVDEEWGVVWQAREDGVQDEIWFQRLDSLSLAPIGSPVNVSQSDSNSRFPTLVWDGANYLVAWFEHTRREPGTLPATLELFALLEADGTILRHGATSATTALVGQIARDGGETPLSWDGTHWGYLNGEIPTTHPFSDLRYRRLAPQGDVVTGPTSVTSTAGHKETNPGLAFNPTLGKQGVAWTRQLDDSAEAFFQRLEESTGALEGSPVSLGAPFGGTYGLSTVANGADGWAVAWAEYNGNDLATYLRKVDASGVADVGGKIRLSDAAPAGDFLPSLHPRPGGGFVVFGTGYSPSGEAYEITRVEAESSGAKDGPVVLISPDDGVSSYRPRVASDGDRFLVVWNESDSEVAGLLVDADGLSAPGPKVDLTSGHTPASTAPANLGVFPLGAGFVSFWLDPAHPGEIRGRSWDGSGATVGTFLPLNSAPLAGNARLIPIGDEFLAIWRANAAELRLARYAADGSLLVGENAISTSTGGAFMADFNGQEIAILLRSGNDFRFRRYDLDGNPIGSETTLFAGSVGSTGPMIWTGGGWAVLWRAPNQTGIYFGFLGPDGTVGTPPTLVAPQFGSYGIGNFWMHWNGSQLGVVWSQRKNALDPPQSEVYFTRLNLDGTKAFPETTVIGSPYADAQNGFYWADGAFRIVHQRSDGLGLREIAVDPADGSVLPGVEFLTNRGGGSLVAWNGATRGIAWFQDQLRALHFETSECVADPSPPPCPALSVASVGGLPRLTWPAVADPQSGIWRYQVIRDGLHLAELDPTTLLFDDAGYRTATTHSYTLLAMNGAFNESDGCTPVPFSTTAGDANGSGGFDIADLFYLINFFHGDGAPPAGDADANGDGNVTGGDLFYLINHFFSGGPPPV